MFDLDRFIADCREAVAEDSSHRAVREVVARAVAAPASVVDALGPPDRGAVQRLYHAENLTIINVVWAPGMTIMPHNHEMWAVIGVYSGREDNIYWRRLPDADGGLIEAAGARSIGDREVVPLGKDIIHSVTNPLGRATGAIHVYGGDFYGTARSEWDPEDLLERPYDVARNMALFDRANARAAA